MKNLTFSVFKIFLKNLFSFGSFFEGFKKGPKAVIKNIFIGLCAIYCLFAFVFLYGTMMYGSYQSLSASGSTAVFPLLAMLMAAFTIIIFGFLSASANYYTNNGEEQFLAMPLTPANIFGAKFGISYVSDAILGLGMFTISAGIYGFKEGLLTNPLFYAGFIFSALAITLITVFIIYFLLILILLAVPSLRKRSFLTIVSTVLIAIFAIFYSLLSTNLTMILDGTQTKIVTDLFASVAKVQENQKFLVFIASALNGNGLAILFMLAVCALVIFVLVPSVSGLYVKTLNGFTDNKTKKLSNKEVAQVLQKGFKRNSVLKTLYVRDVKTVLREPAFFSNGPLGIILLPVICVFSFAVGVVGSGGNLSDFFTSLQKTIAVLEPSSFEKIRFLCVVIAAGISIFLGTSTNTAATSFSREGKALYDLKAMPLEPETIVAAKIWHALTYVFISIFMILAILICGIYILDVQFLKQNLSSLCVQIILLSITPSLLLTFVDMFIDTANPKLLWENPMAAFKQNINSLFSVLILLGVLGIYVALCYVLPKSTLGAAIITLFFGIIAVPVGYGYTKYAKKKFPLM